jgi:hypothetical protein
MFRLIAGILLTVYVVSVGVNHFLQIWGFGVGLGAGILLVIGLNLRYKSPLIFSLFSFLLLLLISFSHFSLYVLNEKITKGYILLYLGIFILILTFFILVLAGYPLRKFFVPDHAAFHVFNIFNWVLILSGVNFLLFDLLAPIFIQEYSDIYGFLIWYILAWFLLMLLLQRVDDKIIKESVQNSGLKTFDLKKQIIAGYVVLIGLSTFFEAFRGLWWVWLGTAIWVTLIFASLWKIWKHVLDVPETKEKSMASSPS